MTPHGSQFGTPSDGENDGMITIGTNTMEPTLSDRVMAAAVATPVPSDAMCIICMDNDVTHAFLPCQHAHFCADCAGLIEAGAVNNENPRCPVCRTEIESVIEASTVQIENQRPQRLEAARTIETFSFLLRNTALASRTALLPEEASSSSTGHATALRVMSETAQEIHELPWWPVGEEITHHYLNQPMMDPEEVGILPDTGAHDGLCSDLFARQQVAFATKAGRKVTQSVMEKPRTVAGVGHGQQVARYEVCLPASLTDIHGEVFEEEYKAPCVENSGIPGLMGIQSLERNNALIRCRTGEIYFLGEGGAEIRASPGSRHFQMKKGKTGHWMLPISNFSDKHKTAGIVLNTSSASSSSAGVSLQQ
jgi:hypothetical protein